ncbi:DUF2065 domain-containing protein [Pseudomonadota bacterium]
MPAFFVTMDWQDLFAALALVMVIEGIMPFVSPNSLRRAYAQMTQMDDRSLRVIGLVSMIVGVVLLTVVKS